MTNKTLRRSGPPQGSTHGETRAEILRHAEQIFANVGFAGASLDMIAEAVGIRRPSLLYHFSSKRALYDQVENEIFTSLLRKGEECAADGSTFDDLINLLNVWLEFMINRPTAGRIMMRNTADLVSRGTNPVQFSEGVVAQFERLVLAGQAAGEFRPADPMLMLNILGGSILHYVCNAEQYGASRIYDPVALSDQFRAMIRSAANALTEAI